MATNIDKALFQQPQGLEAMAPEEAIEIEIAVDVRKRKTRVKVEATQEIARQHQRNKKQHGPTMLLHVP